MNQDERQLSIKFDLMGFRMLPKPCSLPRSSFGFAASDAAGLGNARMYSQLCTAVKFYVQDVPSALTREEGSGTGLVVRYVGSDSNVSAAGAFEDRTLNLDLAIRLHF